MNAGGVRGVRSVEIDVTDAKRVAAFFEEVVGLATVGGDGSSLMLRGTGGHHHILALRTAPRSAVRRIVFDAPDRRHVDALHARVAVRGLPVEPPRAFGPDGRDYGFGLRDPEGRNFAVVASAGDRPASDTFPDSPVKITHVNLNTADQDATTNFLVEGLGFRLIDETATNRFLCCGTDHHSVVVGRGGMTTLNHIAFEMTDLDAMMRGAGRLRDAGYPIEWGVGRHGPGNNAFAYFIGPEELPLEVTAEVLQVDESYEPHGPEHWRWPPGRQDQWGISGPPSARWRRVQHLVSFVPDAWRLFP